MEIKWEKADAATIKAFAETGQKPAVETAREFAEAEANYRMNLECAKDALCFKWLAAEDREAIEIAITRLEIGWTLHEQSSDPIQLGRAANYLMFAAHVIGSRCTVCDSEKKYWELKKSSAGGTNVKEKRQALLDAVSAWHEYVRAYEAARPSKSLAALARGLVEKPRGCPTSMPASNRTIENYLSECRKARKANDTSPVRLVHSRTA
jgi:hypothetical protein